MLVPLSCCPRTRTRGIAQPSAKQSTHVGAYGRAIGWPSYQRGAEVPSSSQK